MTNGEEDPREQAITEAVRALRNLRGRRGPPERAEPEDQTASDPDQQPGSAVVEDTADVGSRPSEEEATRGEISTEGEEEPPADWETLLDRRLEGFREVTRANVKEDFQDFREKVTESVSGLRTQTIFAVLAIVVAGLFGFWQIGESWRDDFEESFQELREDIRTQIDRLDRAGERRRDRIEELEARTDSLRQESR